MVKSVQRTLLWCGPKSEMKLQHLTSLIFFRISLFCLLTRKVVNPFVSFMGMDSLEDDLDAAAFSLTYA